MPAAVALSILFVAGCNGESPQAGEQPSTTPAPPATFAPKPEDEAIKAWKTALDGLSREPQAVTEAQSVANPKALDLMNNYISKPSKAISNVEAKENTDGSVNIRDCVFFDPPFNPLSAAIGFKATVRETNGVWKVEEAFPSGNMFGDEVRTACIPKTMDEAVKSGYRDYWVDSQTFWNPPDPDSPLVPKVATGKTLSYTRDLLKKHQQRDAVMRGMPQLNPEVTKVMSPSEVVVLDCQIQDPLSGLYDGATGKRLPDVDPIKPGQRDAAEVTMKLEDGRWKFAQFSYAVDAPCASAPTKDGVTVW